jgi:hypothetical protein
MESVFVKHTDDQCRALFYKIVVDTFNNHRGFDALPKLSPFRKQINSALLKGLSDPAPDIRRTLVEFWDSKRLHVNSHSIHYITSVLCSITLLCINSVM